jgi:hypothetical protein
MSAEFASVEAAFMALAEPGNPRWGAALAYLSARPETAELILQTFRETLEQMGIAPSGTDPVTGEAAYGIADVARAMGIAETDLDQAIDKPI